MTSHLTAIRNQALANLAEATASPKPTYTIDGQRVDHAGYVMRMQRLIDWCNDGLAAGVEIATTAGRP